MNVAEARAQIVLPPPGIKMSPPRFSRDLSEAYPSPSRVSPITTSWYTTAVQSEPKGFRFRFQCPTSKRKLQITCSASSGSAPSRTGTGESGRCILQLLPKEINFDTRASGRRSLSTTYKRVIDRRNKTPLNEVLFDPQSGQEIIVYPPKIRAQQGTLKFLS